MPFGFIQNNPLFNLSLQFKVQWILAMGKNQYFGSIWSEICVYSYKNSLYISYYAKDRKYVEVKGLRQYKNL